MFYPTHDLSVSVIQPISNSKTVLICTNKVRESTSGPSGVLL